MRGIPLAALLSVTALLAQEPPKATVLFSTDNGVPVKAAAPAAVPPRGDPAGGPVTGIDAESVTFTAYDLDVHLVPSAARMTVRVTLVARNDGATPMRFLPLQISSALRWESVAVDGKAAPFSQQAIHTDADHTGLASEAIVALPEPLAAGASLRLAVFYTGQIEPSAARLERLGAPSSQAAAADWDSIASDATALRGFGNVLWYPVAAEPALLGEGARLFQAVGRQRRREAEAAIRLRLSVEYIGDPPDAAFFCGRRQPLIAVSENKDMPIAESPGVATADFASEPLGFRSPSLFVTGRAATVTGDMLIAAVTEHVDMLPRYAAAAALLKPLLIKWLGPQSLEQLRLIDHAGQPFEDGAFVVAPLRAGAPPDLAGSLVYPLAHAWFHSRQPWLDEGVARFLSLLWIEQSQGREAAVAALETDSRTLALAEPDATAREAAGQPLIQARDPVYLRTKAAAVLWMLRDLVGDDALQQTLLVYRAGRTDRDAEGFETLLETAARKDLRWFFDDWVYSDKGLPSLTVAGVSPRELPAKNGRSGGWLVAVAVRNDGAAVAEIPVTVRSGALSAGERLRIPGGTTASVRILFEGTPKEVQVGDGTVPVLGEGATVVKIKDRE